ncbi:pentapeptide repeat-containing protein [Micromonospora sp. NPDC051296]|uniref:pentapeptide repeat-containing protein n=1 Tax=Micromonospora sp. NPDC051296 TaxID=3155046 RepID=UPI003422B305
MSATDQERAAALCAYLRSGDGNADRRRTAVRSLAGMAGVDLDLSGTVVTDADFGGGRFGAVNFADTRFLGSTSFAGAEFEGEAVFARAVFEGEARFQRARFHATAVFGRTRFRAVTSFAGAEFHAMAWFGRGEEELWEDDDAWDTVEEIEPLPWDEVNETDPVWPVAVVVGDYQCYEEGGDGARFAAPVAFRGASFGDTAWFGKARFAAEADFREARFGGPVHLDSPAVDLTDARWSGDEGSWPWGWSVRDQVLTAEASWAVRTDAQALAGIGDEHPEQRQRVVDAICAYLRTPLLFDVSGTLTAAQQRVIEDRGTAQRVLAARLRPGRWEGMHLWLSGATLVGLDLTGCGGGVAEFTGAQFHGTTGIERAGWDRVVLDLGGGHGRATFHDGTGPEGL